MLLIGTRSRLVSSLMNHHHHRPRFVGADSRCSSSVFESLQQQSSYFTTTSRRYLSQHQQPKYNNNNPSPSWYKEHNSKVTTTTTLRSSPNESLGDNHEQITFQPGSKIQVEVISFGPLGASVDVIATSHNPDDIIPENQPPLGTGLILQKEISYYRAARGNVDVVRGEVLPAYVERVRPDDGKLNIALRTYGGKAKTDEITELILQRLEDYNGIIPVGDKSSPEAIGKEFPGISKGTFKKAVAALYKQRKVQPGPQSIRKYGE